MVTKLFELLCEDYAMNLRIMFDQGFIVNEAQVDYVYKTFRDRLYHLIIDMDMGDTANFSELSQIKKDWK